MNVLIAGVSTEIQQVNGILSFRNLRIGVNDKAVIHKGATGLYARKAVCNEFLAHPEFDALFMLDLDMDYPEDTLAKLREHDLDMVTGHYYRRQTDLMMSIVELSPDGTWPHVPLLDAPQSGLHEVASTGMGCVLIKRKVIEAVAAELPPLSHPFDNGSIPWYTGDEMVVGQDKRFFALARRLGYKLYMDAEVRCRHAITSWIDDDFYYNNRNRMTQAKLTAGLWLDNLERHGMNEKTIKLRMQTLSLEREALLEQFNAIKDSKTPEELQPIVLQLNEYDNRMAECKDWITGVVATVQFPQAPEGAREEAKEHRTSTPGAIEIGDAKAIRENTHQKEAMDYIEELDKRG